MCCETCKKIEEEARLRLETERLKAEAEILQVIELERLRFSIELHDDICQRLSGISMFCKSLLKEQNPKTLLPELSKLIDETNSLTKNYARGIFPVTLDSDLKESITVFCQKTEQQNSCRCVLLWSVPETSPFTPAQELHIFRIIQEAVNNAIKHAKALNIEIKIEKLDDHFSVSIQNDGRIFQLNPESDLSNPTQFIKSGGLGLRSMHYRANQIGVNLSVVSSEHEGTRVVITGNL
jgi:signal transduction histidine kinase